MSEVATVEQINEMAASGKLDEFHAAFKAGTGKEFLDAFYADKATEEKTEESSKTE